MIRVFCRNINWPQIILLGKTRKGLEGREAAAPQARRNPRKARFAVRGGLRSNLPRTANAPKILEQRFYNHWFYSGGCVMRKKFFAALALFALALPGMGLEFSFTPRGFALFPVGAKNTQRYGTGGGADFAFDADISGLFDNFLGLGYAAGLEGGALSVPLNAQGDLSVLSGALGAGVYGFPFSRLFLRTSGAFGVYQAGALDVSSSSWYWRAGGAAGFRFTPNFILSANGGYRFYNDRDHGGAALSGLYVGLALQFNFSSADSAGGVGASVRQEEPAFPVFSALYQTHPAGTLVIENGENAEIRDVRVGFRAEGYTSSEFACGQAEIIPKGGSLELPLFADFSADILGLTENSRLSGEAVIRYRFLGEERETVRNARLQVYSRGMFRWDDPSGLSAFVSSGFPEIDEYSKYLTGLARDHLRTGLNRNHQFAVFLFEGLRAGGVRLSDIPETPYRELRASGLPDTVQFPFQTLMYRTGDMDDLGLLYAALLEAAGLRAAFIPLEDEFIAAVSLGIHEAAAQSLFFEKAKFLVVDDEVWLPLLMSAFNEGFDSAWERAAAVLAAALAAGKDPRFIIVEEAWRVYPPAILPPQNVRYVQPHEAQAAQAADKAMRLYIEKEISPLIQDLDGQIRGNPSAALYNRLGTLYLRAGMRAQAEAAWHRAADGGVAGAMTNMGNLCLLDGDYSGAEKWFRQALTREPENPEALRGLRRIAAQR
jgi:tetratricopeptide (TPR) repeat protein